MTDIPKFPDVFAELTRPEGIAPSTVENVFDAIFAGAWPPAQIGAFLACLRQKSDSVDVIAAAATAMRAVMVRVPHDLGLVLDTCGTGGDHSSTLNLSTGAAVIAAAAGVPVAK